MNRSQSHCPWTVHGQSMDCPGDDGGDDVSIGNMRFRLKPTGPRWDRFAPGVCHPIPRLRSCKMLSESVLLLSSGRLVAAFPVCPSDGMRQARAKVSQRQRVGGFRCAQVRGGVPSPFIVSSAFWLARYRCGYSTGVSCSPNFTLRVSSWRWI